MPPQGLSSEINGDLRLPASDRIRYLVANLARNLAGGTASLAMRAWWPPKTESDNGDTATASPSSETGPNSGILNAERMN